MIRRLTPTECERLQGFPDGWTKGISSTLAGNAGGLGGKTGLYATRYPLKFLERNQKNIEGDYSFTVDGANTGGVKQDMKIRRLTPTECERLQGFPDGWTEGISDTQRYKCLGNAVTTNVVQFIGEQLLPPSKGIRKEE
jgi:site-specific DNA-cytosine methylase